MANNRLPDNVHKLKGTYQPCRHGDPDTKPQWDDGAPEPPEWLGDAALVEWNRVLSKAPVGVITQTDMALFTRYCVLWGRYSDAEGEMGATLYKEMRMHEKELGFTPVSRGKIGGAPKDTSGSVFQSNPK